MTAQNLYNQLINGDISKEKFLYEVRRDVRLPMITKFNSFNDTITILKNKSIISENKDLNPKYKSEKNPLLPEIESLTIDMVSPLEYSKGINYELEISQISVGNNLPSEDEMIKAQRKVLKNLTTDPYYYTKKCYSDIEKKQEKENLRPEELKKDFTSPNQLIKSKVLKEGLGDRKWINIINNHNFDFLDKKNIILFLTSKYSDDLNKDEIEYYADVYAKMNDLPPYDTDDLSEAAAQNNPQIERIVGKINELIKKAVDEDGDPIPVVDKSGTWEEPVIYSPIQYKNGALTITYTEQIGGDSNTETILKRNMEFDGLPTLQYIMRMYKSSLKKAGVKEAVALKDKAGNVTYAKDDTEANTIATQARTKGVQLDKSRI